MKKAVFFAAFILSLVVSCDRQPDDGPAAGAEDIEKRKALAREWTAEAFAVLSGRLMQVITEDGHAAAIEVCSMEADDLLGGVAGARGASIRRVTDRPRNPANEADERALEMMEMVRAMTGRGETAEPVADDDVVWLPIQVGMPVCLTCHGDPGSDIAPATLAAIGGRYPRDRATGYSKGDLRGLWRVEFPDRDSDR